MFRKGTPQRVNTALHRCDTGCDMTKTEKEKLGFQTGAEGPKLELTPIDYAEACQFIKLHHRHHLPPQGWKFGVAVARGGEVVGVVTVGRPVSRHLDDGYTLEVTRCCTDGTKNACSILYGAAWRAAKALGYKRIVTYTLPSEGGASLKASGWHVVAESAGGSWSCESRPRVDKHPLQQKLRWEAA